MWPKQADPDLTEEELRPCLVHVTDSQEGVIDSSRFSKYERLQHTIAYLFRFVDNCRRVRRKEPRTTSHFSNEQLARAENALWRLAQRSVFHEEVEVLTKVKNGHRLRLARTSRIFKLSPFIDEFGVLRIDTRIVGAIFVPYDTKYPVILPKKHRITDLILDWFHRRYLHANHETVTNEVRQRFYVPCLRALVRSLVKRCMQCRITKAKPSCPREGPLPEARLSPYIRPFTFVGLDYFGPIIVKVGRSLAKRWVALFTCLTIRAVHLEVVYSLSTESCKMAIRRFLVRRGSPLKIRSDNGTNFIGASRELQQQVADMNQHLSSTFTNAVTKWVFNPPSAPHMGGSWERLVRSVKVAFATLNSNRNPDDETLLTLMIEAEGIVNSRPLTFVSLELETQEALTPNHFLLLSSQGTAQPPQAISDRPECLRANWKLTTNLVNQFWRRWVREYLPTICRRTKWFEETKGPKEGDPVIFVDESVRNGWLRGRVLSVVKGRDGRARQVLVKTTGGILRRSVTKVAVLDIQPAVDSGAEK
ncbi:uncharacterized protein LOC129773954 [Toxorhynchites rutilus septentrionalis]|uniref:uncharacterized protein LOC129773954 n=1 Tax=Toxorhynchites rutilus septentrionalis TaxID=329112 RepID=UPI00247AB994|nr:uncharacterized protein LOC129773954 [Toxorhynchites rutilus septentrionalis]